jgi:cellulose biosynthesis protein BcsQ
MAPIGCRPMRDVGSPLVYRLLVWTSKGGTGKTTTVANTAPELVRLGYRVLMVGFDPQADLESTFGIEEDTESVTRIEQLLDGGGDPLSAALDIEVPTLPRRVGRRRRDAGGHLRLLACSSQLLSHTADIARRGYEDLEHLLEAFDTQADLALIDTQGALTPISHTAARAADGALFVGEPGYYEFRALASRLAELEELRREEGLEIAPIGLLFVRCSARSKQMREYREHYEDPEASGGEPLYVFQAHTRQQSSVRDHPRIRRPTVIVEPDSHVAQDYRAFAAELVDRLAVIAKSQQREQAA